MSDTIKPFNCPNCGANDQWRADYYEPAYQDVRVALDENGVPYVEDYGIGAYGHYEGDAGDEALVCTNCDWRLELHDYPPPQERSAENIKQQIADAEARKHVENVEED